MAEKVQDTFEEYRETQNYKGAILLNAHISMRGAEHTLRIMQQAPVLIFIVNTLAAPYNKELSMDEQVSEICNAQSIGAAIKNMTLEAAAQVSDLCTGSAVCIRNDNR
mgnify:CR=1 FL=1